MTKAGNQEMIMSYPNAEMQKVASAASAAGVAKSILV